MRFTTVLKLCLVMALGAALTACQSASASYPAGTLPPVTKTDAQVAKVSAEVAKYCTLVGVAVLTAQSFATTEKVKTALAGAEAARAQFCLAPPADVNAAIATLAAMLIQVNSTIRQAPPPAA